MSNTKSVWNKTENADKSLKTSSENAQLQTSFAKKTKENVKTASYTAVVIGGLGATLVVFYVIFQELFSGETAQSFFQYGSKKCMENEKVQDLLGEPIKAYGEETRRHKAKRVAHMEYTDEQGHRGIRLQFQLVGLRRKATVDMDARQVLYINKSGFL